MAAQVEKWNDTVEGQAFSDISSMNVLAQAPKLGDIKVKVFYINKTAS